MTSVRMASPNQIHWKETTCPVKDETLWSLPSDRETFQRIILIMGGGCLGKWIGYNGHCDMDVDTFIHYL